MSGVRTCRLTGGPDSYTVKLAPIDRQYSPATGETSPLPLISVPPLGKLLCCVVGALLEVSDDLEITKTELLSPASYPQEQETTVISGHWPLLGGGLRVKL